ncbi:MAG: mannosyl-3-phosphoglycerate phosphatase [Chloroflexi bacterium CG07_land_8_20_14_0_80_51_10]|nr:MAG: mannosyl-3-phosphoglycerate phosphatase [Chloroflexi bacterium CG07_land_8_20_14_0_80_51_10]
MIEYLPKTVVFTDLDGTLLDLVTYSYDKALPAVNSLRQRGIPIVFCSAKTRAEQEVYRQELGISDPFIVENGGAIFIPQDYFPFGFNYQKAKDEYLVIELGIPYHQIRQILEQVRAATGINFRGFGDMSMEEVATETGLAPEAAQRAKLREYDETLKFEDNPQEVDRVLNAIAEAGLNYVSGGRYYDVMGPNDKGKATRILIGLFQRRLGQIEAVGIGDSANDLPMLSAVDIPVLVQKPGGLWEDVEMQHLHRVEGVGPEGWIKAIEEIVGVK